MVNGWFNRTFSIVLVSLLTVSVFAASCAPKSGETEKIGVVVTILPQAEFVERVGGDQVDITVMVPWGQSPHTYAPTVAQLEAVRQAKVYAMVGSGLEFELVHMGRIMEANRDMLVVDCSEGVQLMEKDPHIWNSPLNARIMVDHICEGLIQVDPENAESYIQNRDVYLKELDVLDAYVHYRLDGFSNRAFMIYHPAFGYLARDYNLTQIPVEHEGKPPTPQLIQDCIGKAKQYSIQYVFVAPQFRTEDCETIANAIEGETIPADPLERHYISDMANLVDLLALEFE
jgi:zinc transport system substrate-binding protein